jgi:hypothetical protein
LQLVSRFPNSTTAKINHGLALLLNRRNSEAGAVFKGIDPQTLSAVETASLYLGLFETYFNELQYDKAAEMSDLIDVKYLFPNQVKWLE